MIRTILTTAMAMLVGAALVVAQTTWYPSRWGADDQRGAANRMTAAKVLEAKNLITRGQTYQLGRVYESGMPIFGTRHYSLRIPKVFGPNGTNQMFYHDEIISGELGQIGTQFDGLGHVGIGDLFYNGNRGSEFAKAEGLTKLGIENVGALVTRGVLVDIAAFKGVPMLAGGYEITLADLEGALRRENVAIRPGDVVLFHTGWGSLWIKDNSRFNESAPGIGLAVGQYLVDHEVTMAGSDTWAVEAVPNPDASLAFPVHQLLIPRNGIYIFENLATEVLARDNAYEFAFFFAPLRLKGATGSPGNPLAIR
jgi:kynurenine formamidase